MKLKRKEMMNKKIYTLGCVFLLSACSTPMIQQSENINLSEAKIQSNSMKVSERGANLSVKFGFKSFNTKVTTNQSVNGTKAKTPSDIAKVKVYLIRTNSANPLLASNVVFSSGEMEYINSGTYTFYNVPSGTYFAAVELFDKDDNNIIEPVQYTSNASGDTAFGMKNGKRGLTISSNSVTVSNTFTYTFNDNALSFMVSPGLKNAVGATIGTNITSNSGSDVTTSAITVEEEQD